MDQAVMKGCHAVQIKSCPRLHQESALYHNLVWTENFFLVAVDISSVSSHCAVSGCRVCGSPSSTGLHRLVGNSLRCHIMFCIAHSCS